VRRRRGSEAAGLSAQASNPLWGVGCGFALQSAEWLADAVGPALAEGADVGRALARYARRHRSFLLGHHLLMSDFATGRPLTRWSGWSSRRRRTTRRRRGS